MAIAQASIKPNEKQYGPNCEPSILKKLGLAVVASLQRFANTLHTALTQGETLEEGLKNLGPHAQEKLEPLIAQDPVFSQTLQAAVEIGRDAPGLER